jgi:hypothetical protein
MPLSLIHHEAAGDPATADRSDSLLSAMAERIAETRLIEIAIVMCVVGLAIGGVSSVTDLVAASRVRSTVAQIETLKSAVNTFRVKFGALPGDMLARSASEYGLFAETAFAGTPGHQDGNGLIEGGGPGATAPVGETVVFWRHLAEADLVPGAFGPNGNAQIDESSGRVRVNVADPGAVLPPTRLVPTQYLVVFASGAANYLQLLPVAELTSSPQPSYRFRGPGITAAQASAIDGKIDDGFPESGAVRARGVAGINEAPTRASEPGQAACVSIDRSRTGPALAYNVEEAGRGPGGPCSLTIRMN